MATRHLRIAVALIASLALVVTLLAGCRTAPGERSLERVRNSGKLVVGIDPSYPPFSSLDAEGSPQGFEIDVASALARRLDVVPDFVSIDVGGMLDALMAKKIDVVISGFAPDFIDRRRLAVSQPYFNAGQIIVARRPELLLLQALAGHAVAVESGSTADLELRRRIEGPSGVETRVESFSSVDQALDAARSGRVDAAVTDAITALQYLGHHSGLLAGKPFTDEYYVLVTRRADTSLLAALDGALDKLDRAGHLSALKHKWLRLDDSTDSGEQSANHTSAQIIWACPAPKINISRSICASTS